MNNIKNKNNIIHFRNSILAAGIHLTVIFAICLVTSNFVLYEASGFILNIARITAYIATFLCAGYISINYAKASKHKNPDGFNPKRDMAFYFKRMVFNILLVVFVSLGASVIGSAANMLVGGLLMNISNLFLQGFILKLPMFIIYLAFIYKVFVQSGFTDCKSKIFNPNFKLLTVMLSLLVMVPDAIHDSMFLTSLTEAIVVNVQTVFSPNVGLYFVENGFAEFNEKFNIIGVLISILITFSIQAVVAWFAYKKGKQIFIKEQIRQSDEYETDENI